MSAVAIVLSVMSALETTLSEILIDVMALSARSTVPIVASKMSPVATELSVMSALETTPSEILIEVIALSARSAVAIVASKIFAVVIASVATSIVAIVPSSIAVEVTLLAAIVGFGKDPVKSPPAVPEAAGGLIQVGTPAPLD